MLRVFNFFYFKSTDYQDTDYIFCILTVKSLESLILNYL